MFCLPAKCQPATPNLPTNIVDFGGCDSSIMLCSWGGILMSIGNFPENLSQAMLVGVMLVEGLGVCFCRLRSAVFLFADAGSNDARSRMHLLPLPFDLLGFPILEEIIMIMIMIRKMIMLPPLLLLLLLLLLIIIITIIIIIHIMILIMVIIIGRAQLRRLPRPAARHQRAPLPGALVFHRYILKQLSLVVA